MHIEEVGSQTVAEAGRMFRVHRAAEAALFYGCTGIFPQALKPCSLTVWSTVFPEAAGFSHKLRSPPLGQPPSFRSPYIGADGYSFILRSSASASASLPCLRRKRTRFC